MDKFDFNEFKIEIERRLEGLSYKQIVYFAWLCSIRAVPFLCEDGGFNFWQGKKLVHLNSVFYAHDICAIITYGNSARHAAGAAYINTNHAAQVAVNVARAAIRATAYAADCAAYNNGDYAAYAALALAKASEWRIRETIFPDIDIISSSSDRSNFNNDTSIYGEQWNNFLDALKAIGCEYWAKQYEELFKNNFVPNIEEIKLRLAVPDAIRAEGAAAVAKHMEALANQGITETKEARIILLGTKGAGKTSLVTKLHNPYATMPDKEDSTPGVDTSNLNLIKGEITHLWDFGGHVIAQAAHKCFMSAECLYILVIDGRTEQQLDIDEHRKWLASVRTYSEGRAKVFVVLNISDGHKQAMPEKTLNEEFPDLIHEFYTLNIKNDLAMLNILKNGIRNFIEENFVRKIPAQYFDIKMELERQFKELNKEILQESDVEKIVSSFKLKDGSKGVLEYLNTLGVALRYDNMPDIVLNPSWISNGIYTIINHMQNNGYIEIHRDDMPKVFTGNEVSRYNLDNCKLLYEIMVKYELAFEMKTKPSTLIVPAVLPRDKPNNIIKPKENEETLVRRYGFDIALADNIFPRYTQRNHEYLEQPNGEYIIWYGGMCLVNNKTYATITKDTRKIEITTWGENKSDFLEELHNRLLELLQEHKVEWDRDEIKLSTKFYATDVIVDLYNENVPKFRGFPIKDILKKFRINIKNVTLVNLGLNINSTSDDFVKTDMTL